MQQARPDLWLGFVGVLIGAATTLTVSWLQHRLGRQERERARQMQLRRDIFLEAAEGLGANIEFLSQSSRSDVPLGKATAQNSSPGWMYKAYLAANTDTLIAFNEAAASIGAGVLDVLGHRLAVAEADDEIALSRTRLDELNRKLESLWSQAQSLNQEPASPEKSMLEQTILERYNEGMLMSAKETTEYGKLVDAHARALRNLLRISARINVGVQGPVRAALLAARTELDMPIDTGRFGAAIAEHDRHFEQKMAEVLRYIKIEGEDETEQEGRP